MEKTPLSSLSGLDTLVENSVDHRCMGLVLDSQFYSGARVLSVIWARGASCSQGVFGPEGEVRRFRKPPKTGKCWEEVKSVRGDAEEGVIASGWGNGCGLGSSRGAAWRRPGLSYRI